MAAAATLATSITPVSVRGCVSGSLPESSHHTSSKLCLVLVLCPPHTFFPFLSRPTLPSKLHTPTLLQGILPSSVCQARYVCRSLQYLPHNIMVGCITPTYTVTSFQADTAFRFALYTLCLADDLSHSKRIINVVLRNE